MSEPQFIGGGYCWYSHHLKDGGSQTLPLPQKKTMWGNRCDQLLEWPTRIYTLADQFESDRLISSFWKCHLNHPKKAHQQDCHLLPSGKMKRNKTHPDSVFSAPTIKLKIFKTKDDEPVNCVPGGKSVTFPSPIFALSTFFSSIFHRKSPPPTNQPKVEKNGPTKSNPSTHCSPSPPPTMSTLPQ